MVALLVCLIPTTIGGLLSAIGIAGMDRMIRANVIATRVRAFDIIIRLSAATRLSWPTAGRHRGGGSHMRRGAATAAPS